MSVCAATVQHHHNAAGKVEIMTARGSTSRHPFILSSGVNGISEHRT